jgi:hypothetical protein
MFAAQIVVMCCQISRYSAKYLVRHLSARRPHLPFWAWSSVVLMDEPNRDAGACGAMIPTYTMKLFRSQSEDLLTQMEESASLQRRTASMSDLRAPDFVAAEDSPASLPPSAPGSNKSSPPSASTAAPAPPPAPAPAPPPAPAVVKEPLDPVPEEGDPAPPGVVEVVAVSALIGFVTTQSICALAPAAARAHCTL